MHLYSGVYVVEISKSTITVVDDNFSYCFRFVYSLVSSVVLCTLASRLFRVDLITLFLCLSTLSLASS
jgi:hypothetical protein